MLYSVGRADRGGQQGAISESQGAKANLGTVCYASLGKSAKAALMRAACIDPVSRWRKSEMPEAFKTSTLFEQLKSVGTAITEAFGEICEVVIHDVSDLDHSIIWIKGNVTNRRIGGCITDLGLAKIRSGDTQDLFRYTTTTEDGKTLTSSSVFLKDREGELVGVICINVDVTPFLTFAHTLRGLCGQADEHEISEVFLDDVGDVLSALIAESAYDLGKPVSLMTKEDRLVLLSNLERKGAFGFKKAVPLIAERLGVSRFTIYNYMNEIRGNEDHRDHNSE